MTPQEFIDQTNGRSWDVDGAYGGQCWDLFAKFCQMVNVPLSVIHCSTTGYVRDIWNNRNTNGILVYFDEVHEYKDGDWLIWDSDYAMTPQSHVGMYWKGLIFNQTKGKPAYLLELDASKAKGGFRWKGWTQTMIPEKFSEILYQGTTLSMYKAPEGYSLYMLSAGVGQVQDIKQYDHPKLEILAVCNCGYFQMSREGQSDPYGTHYGVEQTFDGVDLAPKKHGLQVFYQQGDRIGACRSDEYWFTRDQVRFAFTPYSVIRHEGKTVVDRISTDLGTKEFVQNMQTMIMYVDGRWCLCIAKTPVLPSVMLGFAESVNATEAVLCDSGGSTQMLAYVDGTYTPIMYTGRRIPNVLCIAREKAQTSDQTGQGEEPTHDTEPSENGSNEVIDMNENVTKTLLPDRVYDVLKWIALIALPALAVFVLTMGADLTENYEVIAKFINGIAVLLGSLLGVSTVQYNNVRRSDNG